MSFTVQFPSASQISAFFYQHPTLGNFFSRQETVIEAVSNYFSNKIIMEGEVVLISVEADVDIVMQQLSGRIRLHPVEQTIISGAISNMLVEGVLSGALA